MKPNQEDAEKPISLKSLVYHNPEIIAAPMEDELVMFSLERGMYYGLDDIASIIWERLDDPITVEKLCEELLDEFEVERETCQRETLDLLNWLFEQDLIKIDVPTT